MIKPGALVMAVVMTGVTAGTYYGLDFVPPKLLGTTFGRAPAAGPPPLPGTQDAYTEGVGMRRAATNVEQLARVGAEDPLTEADLAEAPPPAPAPAEAEPAATAPAPQPEPAAAAEPAPSEPEPTPPPAQAAAPEPEPAAQASAPKPRPAPSSSTTVAKASSGEPAAPAKPKPPEADVIKPWWPDPAKMPAEQLKLQYAGQVQGEQAIALLFSAPLNIETIKQHAQVRSGSGQVVNGQWELGKNPRLAVFRGVQTGRYTVVLQPEIADAQGFMLGTTLQGPVYIQAP